MKLKIISAPTHFNIHISLEVQGSMLYCNFQPQFFYVNRQGKLFSDFPR
jgi:hypothetical protein